MISRYNRLIMIKSSDSGFKIIIAGSSGVGKSSLLIRFVDNEWSDSLLSTIGVDFKFKSMTVSGNKVKLQIWDTAGSEAFRSIVSAYYRGADAVVLVFDITSKETFEELKEFWIEEVKKYKEPNCELMLLANKSDLEKEEVSQEEIKELIKNEGICIFKETSAKTGDRVNEAFKELTEKLLKKNPEAVPKKMAKL